MNDQYQANLLTRKYKQASDYNATDSLIVRIILGAFVGATIAAVILSAYAVKNGF